MELAHNSLIFDKIDESRLESIVSPTEMIKGDTDDEIIDHREIGNMNNGYETTEEQKEVQVAQTLLQNE